MTAGYLKNLLLKGIFLTFLVNSAMADPGSGFTARLMNLETDLKNPFRFYLQLKPSDAKETVYQLNADLPQGWIATFRTEGSSVTAVEANKDKVRDIELEIIPSPSAKPGLYPIPVKATSGDKNLALNLEAVVKGHYDLSLSTPDGRLSEDITEGRTKQIILTLKNSGTLLQENVELSAQTPSRWQATFEPAKVDRLEPGKTVEVKLQLSAPDKAIAGDYQSTFTARTNHSNATASFRVTVKTSLLSGWLGILVIAAAFGLIYQLIKKYGRR